MFQRHLRLQPDPEPWKKYELLKTSWHFQTREFFDHSTLHGIRYIAEAERPFFEKFMWFCLTAIGFVVSLIIIVSLWEKFQTNPTITGLDTDFHNWEVPFPAVTLCQNNPANESVVHDYVMRTWGNSTSDEKVAYYEDFVTQIALLSYNNMESIKKFVGDKNLPQSNNLHELQTEVVSSCQDMIFDCEWKGSPYNCCEGFMPIVTENGFCYSFNSRHSQANLLRTNNEEGRSELQLIHETDSKWSILINMDNVESNNVRVYIHNTDEIPGVDMAPQHIWKRRIKQIFFSSKQTYTTLDVRQLSIKQRHCVFPDEIKLETDNIYTYSACMMECRMKEARRLCGCVPFFYKTIEGYTSCNLNGLGCIASYLKLLEKGITCPCELGCMNTVYEVEKLNDGISAEGVPLEIGFVSWPMVRYKREVLFGWVDLLVSFGGIAGLFLGFSLLSGVEIIYYFTMRACCMVYRNKDELVQLHEEYEQAPKPEINLDLKPYFLENRKILPLKDGPFPVKQKIFSVNTFVN